MALTVAPIVCELPDASGRLVCGRLTTDHPASSYGLPVYVRDTTTSAYQPSHRALGVAEVGPLTIVDEVANEAAVQPILSAARAAGYVITLVTWEQSGRGRV